MLIYGVDDLKLNLITPKETTQKKRVPWWGNLFLSLGVMAFIDLVLPGIGELLDISAFGLLALETTTDIASQVIIDELTGYNDPLTLGLDITMPFLRFVSRASRVARYERNRLIQISSNLENKSQSEALSKLAKKLQQAGINGSAKEYEQALKEFNKISLSNARFVEQDIKRTGQEAVNAASFQNAKLKQTKSILRRVNRALAMLDPTYTVRVLTDKITKPIKKYINKKISSMIEKIPIVSEKMFNTVRKTLNKEIIPLNHTVAPWIRGIRLISAYNLPTFFNVEIYFDPNLTRSSANPRGKPPILLYNKHWETFILPFLESPSAGQYYLDNIQWGRDVGAFLRNNAFLQGLGYVPYIQKYISIAFAVKRTILRIRRISNINYWKSKQKNFDLIGAVLEGAIKGLKIPGLKLAKQAYKSYSTGDMRYLFSYTKSQIKKRLKRHYVRRSHRYIKSHY